MAGIGALLRTAGALYLAMWAVAALVAPGAPLRAAVTAVLVPAAPLLLIAFARAMLARQGRALRLVPFAAWTLASAIALAAAHAVGAVAGPLLVPGAVAAAALGTTLLSAPSAAGRGAG
jgi:hypothetical protein